MRIICKASRTAFSAGFTRLSQIHPADDSSLLLASLLFFVSMINGKLTAMFITIDPERDTADQLAFYISEFDSRIVALGQAESILVSTGRPT